MKQLTSLKNLTTGLMLSLGAFAAQAGTGTGTDAFQDFQDTVYGWAHGALGTGLATTMLLVGAGMGVARNSPMPALSGIAGAAFLHWGPDIILNMMNSGALF